MQEETKSDAKNEKLIQFYIDMVLRVFIIAHLTTFLEILKANTSGGTFRRFWYWLKNELLYEQDHEI